LNCKKYTGTVFTTNVVFPHSSHNITEGEDLITVYHDEKQDSSNPLDRHFCSKCGSPLFNTGGDGGKSMAVFYGAIDEWPDECLVSSANRGEEKGGEGERLPPGPAVEYYGKDRTWWVSDPVCDGAKVAATKPGREDDK
jgi:hypothetical protein